MGITTTFVVVVMLLLFSASCSKEHKEVVDVEFDPDKTYTMKATERRFILISLCVSSKKIRS